MKEYIKFLSHTKLFSGISESDIESMLTCLQANKLTFSKGEYIFRRGENIRRIGILVSGLLHIQKDDYWGNCSIINIIKPGNMFGEAYAFPSSEPLLNDVVCVENSVVIFFDIQKMLTTCNFACKFHSMTISNLFQAVAEKNLSLIRKLHHVTQKNTREKLISYLSEESEKAKSSSFSIPFNRKQLADFLSVDRSAMSNELCKMRDEGLLLFDKNNFTLL